MKKLIVVIGLLTVGATHVVQAEKIPYKTPSERGAPLKGKPGMDCVDIVKKMGQPDHFSAHETATRVFHRLTYGYNGVYTVYFCVNSKLSSTSQHSM